MSSRGTGHRAPLLWLVIPAMAGLALAHAGLRMPSPAGTIGACAALLVGAGLATSRPRAWAALLAPAVVLMSLLYGQLLWTGVPERAGLPPREARLEVRIERIFTQEPGRSTGLGRVVGADRHLAALTGERVYWAANTNSPVRGAVVELLGVLTPLPADPDPESFAAYLENTGTDFTLRRATLLRTIREAPAYYRRCDRLRGRLLDTLGLDIERHPGLGGIVRAMALGEKAELSEAQRDLFVRSGTMHLFAISGLHITVIAVAFELLLTLARLPGWARFVVGTAALWLYVDVTGAVPSAVRAFIMVFFVHAAFRWRVAGNAPAALAAAAVTALVIAPEQLFSASYQLSYGIVASLLLCGLPLAGALRERFALFRSLPEAAWTWREKSAVHAWRWTLDSLAISVAATLVGLLGGVVFFGVLTPGAFAANLVLVPLASLTLMAAVGSMLTGLIGASWLAVVFNHAAALLAWAMQALVELALRVPGMSFPAKMRWPELGPPAIAGVVVWVALAYARKWPPLGLGLIVPAAWVAAVLVFGVRLG